VSDKLPQHLESMLGSLLRPRSSHPAIRAAQEAMDFVAIVGVQALQRGNKDRKQIKIEREEELKKSKIEEATRERDRILEAKKTEAAIVAEKVLFVLSLLIQTLA
jgi:hypothetical protein